MSTNPYDFYRERQPMSGAAATPPKPLALAVTLMYVGAALSILSLLSLFLMEDQIREEAERSMAQQGVTDVDIDAIVTIAVTIGVVVALVAAGLWLWMAAKNKAGRSWARVVATVLGCLTVVSTLMSFTAPTTTAINLVFSLVNIVLAVVILVLLWRPESSAYYRARSARY